MQVWSATPVPDLPGWGLPPRLYDTATASMRTLPGEGATEARMYTCGITPYDATHLGHAFTYVLFDTVHRVWLDAGYRVSYLQNVTDIDDPLFERAHRDGVDWQDLARGETDRYRDDMAALRVLPPSALTGVTEVIAPIAEGVQRLQARGAAYDVDGDVYFSIDADPHFGSIAHLGADAMRALSSERGGDPDRPGKKNPLDPLLWRAERSGEPAWDSVVGRGRPGWHIECSIIALQSLGMGFDVQGGGCDLSFPHHEMSASHASVLTEEFPFARAYVHVGMVGFGGEKMSKSKGNLVFVSSVLAQGVQAAAIRLALLAHHYQHDWEWTADELATAEKRLAIWRRAVAMTAGPNGEQLLAAVRTALSNDLDTPTALEVVDRWAAEALAPTSRGDVDGAAPRLVARTVDALLGVPL